VKIESTTVEVYSTKENHKLSDYRTLGLSSCPQILCLRPRHDVPIFN